MTQPAGGFRHPGETEATRTIPSRQLLTVEAAAARLAIGRTTMFSLLKSGAIASIKIAGLRCVPAEAIADYISTLPAAHRPAAA